MPCPCARLTSCELRPGLGLGTGPGCGFSPEVGLVLFLFQGWPHWGRKWSRAWAACDTGRLLFFRFAAHTPPPFSQPDTAEMQRGTKGLYSATARRLQLRPHGQDSMPGASGHRRLPGEPWVISVKTLTFPQFWSGAFCGQEPSLAEARLATEPGRWGQLRGTRGGEEPPALPLSEGSPNPLRI